MAREDDARTRARASRRLHATDAAAEFVVTFGGFSVLAAVLGICVYLAWVVAPLFRSGTVDDRASVTAQESMVDVRDVVVGPYGRIGVLLGVDGSVGVIGLEDGAFVGWARGAQEVGPTAWSVARNGGLLAEGYGDGTVRLGSVEFETELLEAGAEIGEGWIGLGEVLDDGRTRFVRVEETLGDPVKLGAGSGGVVMLDYRVDPTGKTTLAALREDGTVVVSSVRTIRPLGGGAPRTRLRETSFVVDGGMDVADVKITADGANLLVLGRDGTLVRASREGSEGFVERERVETLGDGGVVSGVEMLFGGMTLVFGDDTGRVQAWHVTLDESDRFGDKAALVRSHEFKGGEGAIVDLTPSSRDRTISMLDESGMLTLRHMTSEKIVANFRSEAPGASVVAMGPRNDTLVLWGDGGTYERVSYEEGYPEFGVKALFGKVHYEGLAEPAYVYQSSSGSDASEVKLNLVPLIFGTLKATVFAMLFAIPVAVLAAMYSSEFLSKRVRRFVKPTVELMASLPSVVLGFIAAIVVAPYVRDWLPSFLVGILIVPLVILLGAHVWQLAPIGARRKLRTGQHLTMVFGTLGLGILVSWLVGPWVEGVLFAPGAGEDGYVGGADIRRWLNGEYGGAEPGWVIALFPLCAIGVWIAQAVFVRRAMDLKLASKSHVMIGVWVLGKFVVCAGLALGFAFVGAHLLAAVGMDPRDSVFGTFSPRNTFVVAVIMGFAVIPIIFTISEDALQAVPNSLRFASLGAGATPWQTATRVVFPVAASGIFSACMIGFGRAVGETMIVLMATGNTPSMDWNIFSGFRTLAANIAVELPEAPKDETHYRVLFLCGLVLFLMTFVINTSAEVVRRVVRGRNAGL